MAQQEQGRNAGTQSAQKTYEEKTTEGHSPAEPIGVYRQRRGSNATEEAAGIERVDRVEPVFDGFHKG